MPKRWMPLWIELGVRDLIGRRERDQAAAVLRLAYEGLIGGGAHHD